MALSIEERRQLLRGRFAVWTPRTLHERLDDCAAAFAERPFVITDDRTITYAETVEWSQRLADGFAAIGVEPGDRVGLLMANYLEFVPLKFAISRAGAVAIPFNFLYRSAELAYVLEQSRCDVLVTMTGFAGLDYLGMLDEIAPGWEGTAGDRLPDLRRVVTLPTDGRSRDGVLSVDGLAGIGDRHPGATASVERRPDDVGDILYTSGTTGAPKGVTVTHDAVQRTGYGSALTRAYEDGRRILFSLPCYHMFGYVEGLLSVMFVGGAIIPQTSFDPIGYLSGVERHRATDILCVPTMAVAILEHPGRHDHDLASLRAILCGSAPAPVWLWEKALEEFGISEIVTGYGMTECGGAMTLTLPEDPLELTSTTVGRPKLAGAAGVAGGDLVVYKTVDPITGEDRPDGAEGELASMGPSTMLGFWDKPEETARAFVGGWLRSGDLGRVDPQGYLRLTGRSKELYKSGGELVMPKEIEDLLSAHPDVSDVYAVGLVDDRWGEIGCAVVVRHPGAVITSDDVIAICKQKLAQFKVPKRVLFLERSELPTTPTGKVQKFRLVELARKRQKAEPGSEGRYAALIRPTQVHGSLYTDPAIFAEELEKIWYTTWVYVGHESEVAEPNDYIRKTLGLQDVVMTRDGDGVVHLLLNRCAHRGNQVCEDAGGNSGSFRCPYHGWTYRNTGELLGYPYNKGYGGKNRLDLRLAAVPRVASYRGFVFASFASDGPSLEEHLGAAAGELDRLARLSPDDTVELTAGWLKHRTMANWKLLAENETDGYHPQFVHSSIFRVTGSPIGALYSDGSTAVTRDLGGGHSENDLRPEFRRLAEPMRWFGTTAAKMPGYAAAMHRAYGDEAERIMIEGGPHVMIFPNLFVAEIQVFNIQPVAVGECIQYSTAVQLKGAKELNRRMISQSIGSVGPAGMLLADDTEMYERNQRGVAARNPEWLDVSRGLVRETVDDDGFTVGAATDEVGMRGFWAHYQALMEA